MIEYATQRIKERTKNGMDNDNHSNFKMMFVIEYKESRVVYLFDDLEAPTSYSKWLRLNINNSFSYSKHC